MAAFKLIKENLVKKYIYIITDDRNDIAEIISMYCFLNIKANKKTFAASMIRAIIAGNIFPIIDATKNLIISTRVKIFKGLIEGSLPKVKL
jgi:hypothetical protein